jgi:hypothetical protein
MNIRIVADVRFQFLIKLHTHLYVLSLHNLVRPKDGSIRAEACSLNQMFNKPVLCLADINWFIQSLVQVIFLSSWGRNFVCMNFL